MRTSLIISANSSIDFLEVRESVLRIPEVQAGLKRAQKLVDKFSEDSKDIIVFMCNEDKRYWANAKIRKITTAVVQIALYERWLKRNPEVEAVVAIDSRESPLDVLVGKKSLADYIADSLEDNVSEESFTSEGELVLSSGIKKPQYTYYVKDHEGNFIEGEKSIDPEELVLTLNEEHGIGRFVNIGPGQNLVNSTDEGLIGFDLRIEDSISTDPLLSWFAQEQGVSPLALAN